jgi:hypothetical protein
VLLDTANGSLRGGGTANASATGAATASARLATRLEDVIERLIELSGRHDGGCKDDESCYDKVRLAVKSAEDGANSE